MPARVHVSDVQQFAERIGVIIQRIEALERMSGRGSGGGGGGTDEVWIGPTQPTDPAIELWYDSDAPTIPVDWTEADARYLNVGGDTATGPITITGAVEQKIKLVGTGVQTYIGFYAADGTTRVAALNTLEAGSLRMTADVGPMWLRVGAIDAVSIATTGWLTTNTHITCNGAVHAYGSPGVIIRRTASPLRPYIEFQNTDGTPHASIVGASTGMEYNSLGSSQVFMLNTVEQCRIVSGAFLLGYTTSAYATQAGCSLFGTGQSFATIDTNGLACAYWYHIGAADAAGTHFLSMRRTGNATIGTISQVATTGVAYNTTSHGPWKGEVATLDLRAAAERVLRWRPVSFRWKHIDGDPTLPCSEDGVVAGEVEHGFIAQDMIDVTPQAVTPQVGTEAEHWAWLDRGGDETGEPDPFTPAMGDWSRLVADLTAAVQYLLGRVVEQDARIAALEGGG